MDDDTKKNPRSSNSNDIDLPDILKKDSAELVDSTMSSDEVHWMALLRDDVDPFEQGTVQEGVKEEVVDNDDAIENNKSANTCTRDNEEAALEQNASNSVSDSETDSGDGEGEPSTKTASEVSTKDDDLGMLWEEPKETKGKAKKLIILFASCVGIVVLIVLSVFFLNDKFHSGDSSYVPNSAKAADTNLITVLQSTIAYNKDGTVIDTTTLVSKDDSVTQLTADPETINTGKLGKQKVTYIVTTADGSLEVTKTFTVKDVMKPVIEFNEPSMKIARGDTFDAQSNIRSVTDDVDGDLIEVKKGEKPGYYITSGVKNDTAGNYTVTVTAIDKAGNETNQEYTVDVENVNSQQGDNSSVQPNSSKSSNSATSQTAVQNSAPVKYEPIAQPSEKPIVNEEANNAATRSVTEITSNNDNAGEGVNNTPESTSVPETRIWTCTEDGQSFASAADAQSHSEQTGHKITSYITR